MSARPAERPTVKTIKPFKGFQTRFLRSGAKVVIGGGAAGGGKSGALLQSFLPQARTPGANGIYFRREYPRLQGVWDNAKPFYLPMGAKPVNGSPKVFQFPSPNRMLPIQFWFSHMQHAGDAQAHKSNEYSLVCFDELSEFEASQFWYLMSRMRSKVGIRSLLRAGTNPDPRCFVAELIDWWIGSDGFPIPERAGVIRYALRFENELIWADDPTELIARYGKRPMSFTYIPGLLSENPLLQELQPGYMDALDNMHEVDRQALLLGNWHAVKGRGDFFSKDWFSIWEDASEPTPLEVAATDRVRAWDRAYTPMPGNEVLQPGNGLPYEKCREKPPSGGDPDWTRGVLVSRLQPGSRVHYVIEDMIGARDKPPLIDTLILDTARRDGPEVRVALQYGGPAEEDVMRRLAARLNREGFRTELVAATKSKETYAQLPSIWSYRRKVAYRPGEYWRPMIGEMVSFPPDKPKPGQVKKSTQHDDIIDALATAFRALGEPDWTFSTAATDYAIKTGTLTDEQLGQLVGY